MEYLPLALLPQRLNTIRFLKVSCDFSGIPPLDLPYWAQYFSEEDLRVVTKRKEKWQKMWRIIAGMEGLQRLHVRLLVNDGWYTLNRESAAELLEPVKQVTRPQSFVLSIPIPAMYEGMSLPSRPSPWTATNG